MVCVALYLASCEEFSYAFGIGLEICHGFVLFILRIYCIYFWLDVMELHCYRQVRRRSVVNRVFEGSWSTRTNGKDTEPLQRVASHQATGLRYVLTTASALESYVNLAELLLHLEKGGVYCYDDVTVYDTSNVGVERYKHKLPHSNGATEH